jgi:hypothetical protein
VLHRPLFEFTHRCGARCIHAVSLSLRGSGDSSWRARCKSAHDRSMSR